MLWMDVLWVGSRHLPQRRVLNKDYDGFLV